MFYKEIDVDFTSIIVFSMIIVSIQQGVQDVLRTLQFYRMDHADLIIQNVEDGMEQFVWNANHLLNLIVTDFVKISQLVA